MFLGVSEPGKTFVSSRTRTQYLRHRLRDCIKLRHLPLILKYFIFFLTLIITFPEFEALNSNPFRIASNLNSVLTNKY